MVYVLNIITFTVKYLQVLKETNVKKVVDVVVRNVELLQLLESLDSLHLLQFTPGQMQNLNIFKWCADVTEGSNNWVIKF